MKEKYVDSQKVQGTVVRKEAYADCVLDLLKGPVTIDFLGKCATVDNASYCQFLGEY